MEEVNSMIGNNYLVENCSLYIENKLIHGEIIYRVCYESDDGLESGWLKDFKYRRAAENYIKRLREGK